MNAEIYLRMGENMTRINSLQALRALAFLSILAAHCGCPGVQGALGVSVFFMLSGFCFAINYIPKADRLPTSPMGCIRFSVSKIGKLYVLHLLMIAYKMLFLWAMPQNAGDIVKLILQVLLLQSFVPDPYVISAYNGVSWFLSTYMFVCIAAPFIVRRVAEIEREKRLAALFVGIIALMAALAFASPYLTAALSLDFPTYFTYYFPPYRMLDFTLGVLLGRLYTLRGGQKLPAYREPLGACGRGRRAVHDWRLSAVSRFVGGVERESALCPGVHAAHCPVRVFRRRGAENPLVASGGVAGRHLVLRLSHSPQRHRNSPLLPQRVRV